jgi:hypothetical protein
MNKYIAILFMIFISVVAHGQVKVTSAIHRADQFTSSLIDCDFTVVSPIGTTVKFPKVSPQDGVNFISRTIYPRLQQDQLLVSRVSYSFIIPQPGHYELAFPDLQVNTEHEIQMKSLPSFSLDVLSRLPKDSVISLPFVGKIKVAPKSNTKTFITVFGVMFLVSLIGLLALKRYRRKSKVPVLERLYLFRKHGELSASILRMLLLESIGLGGRSYSDPELFTVLSTSKKKVTNPNSFIQLITQLTECSFSRDGELSDELINQAIDFLKQQQMRDR